MSLTNYLGIRVEGDITKSHKQAVPQRPAHELAPLILDALNVSTLEAIRWRQYTPYFNDGDPCEFNIYEVTFKPTGVEFEDDGDYEDGFIDLTYGDSAEKIWGKAGRTWNGATRQYDELPYSGPDEAAYNRLKALAVAIPSGAFYDVLLDAFGDHAVVTVTRDCIEIESYDHD